MTVYSKIQFPQAAAAGFTYQANVPNAALTNYSAYIPSTATLNGAITPPGWDPYSSNAANRVMYVPDANGTMTYDQVMLAAYGLKTLQSNQVGTLMNQMNNQMDAGIPVVIDGVTYSLSVTAGNLGSNIAKVMSAYMVMREVTAWVAGTDYPPASMVSVNGVVLFTSAGGTSGSSIPTAPTAFETPVTDGSVSWSLMGMLARLTNNEIAWFTPQNIISAFKQAMLGVTDAEAVLLGLIAEINAATDYGTISAITYPAAASTSNTTSASA